LADHEKEYILLFLFEQGFPRSDPIRVMPAPAVGNQEKTGDDGPACPYQGCRQCAFLCMDDAGD
jgi:hypothetical protein